MLNLQDKPDHVWGKVFCINSSLQVSNRQIPRFKKMARCKTRLGNQLSSYAAVRYFQERWRIVDSLTDHSCIPHRFGMTPLLDPFQMRIIKSVFNDSMLKVWNFNCGEKKKVCSLNRHWTADFHQRWGLWIWRHAAKGADGSQWWLWRWTIDFDFDSNDRTMISNQLLITARQKNRGGNWILWPV